MLKRTTLLKLVCVGQKLREEGWKRFVKHKFPALSFADCTSFVVMDKFGITDAFTFDNDFRRAGDHILPGRG